MSEAVLEIRNLHKHFGGVHATNDFNLYLEPGGIYGLIGPNGAGKTTIFNMITGIYHPSSGDILYMGDSIVGKAPSYIANIGIGRTFQNIRLFSQLNVLENVIIAAHKEANYSLLEAITHLGRYREKNSAVSVKAMELLKHVGLADQAYAKAGSLPYGHQRRLEIARALALEPKLLLLDEPAAGMNPAESAELIRFVSEIKKQFGLTILMIEHHMDVVSGLCDHVTVLNFGSTIATGTAEQVQKNPVVIEAYLGGDDEC